MCGLMWTYFTNIWNFQEARVGVWGVTCEGEADWEGGHGERGDLPETIWRDSERCGDVLKRNVTNISKITQTEDRLPGSHGKEYG